MDASAISLNNLCKTFQGIRAVDNVTLEIEKGEIFGLLGPNGAGKSTLIKMLTTMLRPSSGTASILGHDIIQEMDAVRSCIGVVFQDATLDGKLTARENLDFHAQLYNIGRNMRSKRIDEVLDLVDLRDKADVMAEKYSGGMQRRLAIARGLINHPQVLFLDEPTLGFRCSDSPPYLGVYKRAECARKYDHTPDDPLHGGSRSAMQKGGDHRSWEDSGCGHAPGA